MEVAHVVVEARIVLPRRRDEDGQRLGGVRALTADEKLEGVVEQRRVGPVPVECRRERGLVPERPLPRFRPRDVAVDRVDLAVVTEQAERLGALPARLRVRGEALVEDREGDGESGILEIRVEPGKLCGRAERLVGHRAERERSDVDAGNPLGTPPRPIRTALGVGMLRGGKHQLLDPRQRGDRGHAERRRAGRHLAPAGGPQPLRAARVLDRGTEPALAQEAHRNSGAADPGEHRTERDEDARAVSGHPVGRPCSPVPDRREACERPVEELPRSAALQVGDEADATRAALASGVVEEAWRFAHCACRLSIGGTRLPAGAPELDGGGGKRSPASYACAQQKSRTR